MSNRILLWEHIFNEVIFKMRTILYLWKKWSNDSERTTLTCSIFGRRINKSKKILMTGIVADNGFIWKHSLSLINRSNFIIWFKNANPKKENKQENCMNTWRCCCSNVKEWNIICTKWMFCYLFDRINIINA